MVRRHPSKAGVWTARLLLVPGGARRSMEKVTFATGSASKASVGASNLKSTQQQKKQGGIKARDMKRGHGSGSSCKGGTAGALCTRLNAVRLLPNPKPQTPNLEPCTQQRPQPLCFAQSSPTLWAGGCLGRASSSILSERWISAPCAWFNADRGRLELPALRGVRDLLDALLLLEPRVPSARPCRLALLGDRTSLKLKKRGKLPSGMLLSGHTCTHSRVRGDGAG